MFPDGNYNCGLLDLTEGCFCKSGYVRGTDGKCIRLEECGCRLPDNSTVLQMGMAFVSEDCQSKYECKMPQSAPVVTRYPACSPYARCYSVLNNPACVCNKNFEGNGYTCNGDLLLRYVKWIDKD